jgi:hypothetical protein
MRVALFRGSNLDLARVMGVFDSAVRIPRAKPLLGRPAVEGITTLPSQNRSNNDLHGGSFQQYPNAVRPSHHALLIICQIAQQACELAHTSRIFLKPALPRSSLHSVTVRVLQRCSGMSYILKRSDLRVEYSD